ncbi:MAG: glycosyltransferase [Lachnospiraceae bacterium]|nr:glycosyltransferase [Lachnospiraceae bacterium]
MYNISIDQNYNKEPWNIPLEERMRILRNDLSKGLFVNMLIYEYPDTSTFSYRGYNVHRIMRGSDKWRVVYFYRHELQLLTAFIKKVKLVTVSRVKWNHDLKLFIDAVKNEGIPVAFDVDDRIYDLNYLPLVTNTLGIDFNTKPEVTYDIWFAMISRIEMTARMADCYIGTNAFLSDALTEKFGKKGYIIPNFLNEEQLEVSSICCEEKKKQRSERPFVIGYFSGTPSHINDFKTIYKEILLLLCEYPDIILRVVGFMEFPKEMKKYIENGRVELVPLVDFIKLQELTACVDVNIVPLVINSFTNCKSELKFFESAIVDTVTCAAKTFTYKNAINNGETGFLCGYSQWYSTIKDIYLGKYDIDGIVNKAHLYAVEHYYGDAIIKQITNVYDEIIVD